MPPLQKPHLLLLPGPPKGISRSAFHTLYRPTLNAVLARLGDADHPSTLIIALSCQVLEGAVDSSTRRIKWKYAQSLLAGLYVLVASVCAERGIATDVGATEPGSVDVRIVLVDHERGRTYDLERRRMQWPSQGNGTTVPDLASFAGRSQSWQTVFHPSSEDGYALLAAYLELSEGKNTLLQKQLVAVDGGTALSVATSATVGSEAVAEDAVDGYNSVCLGGTFDHLHPGHKLLLHATALLIDCAPNAGKELIVGISGDALLTKKQYAEELQPWTTRARSVISFLSTVLNLSVGEQDGPSEDSAAASPKDNEELQANLHGDLVLVRCVNIPDPFGPTITEQGIQAIVVSEETRSGGRAINEKREAKGWSPLAVYEIDVLDAGNAEDDEDEAKVGDAGFESKISSTMIRRQKMEAREAHQI